MLVILIDKWLIIITDNIPSILDEDKYNIISGRRSEDTDAHQILFELPSLTPSLFFSLSHSLSRSDRVRRHTSSRRWYHPRRALTAADALLLREPSAVAISADSNKTAVTKSVPPYICHYVSLSPILFIFFFFGVSNTK